MRREGNRLKSRVKQRARIDLKTIVVASVSTAAIAIALTLIFNFTRPEQSIAASRNNFEVMQMEEQEFSSELSIPEPIFSKSKKPGLNTILIQSIKPISEKD